MEYTTLIIVLLITVITIVLIVYFFKVYKSNKYNNKILSLPSIIYYNHSNTLNAIPKYKIQSNKKFTHKLINLFQNNYTLSPLSIAYLLLLLETCVFDDKGRQKTRLLDTTQSLYNLDYYNKIFNTNIIKLSNMVVINEQININMEYLNTAKNLALFTSENFNKPNHVVEKLNNFIESNTNGLIKNIFDENMINNDLSIIIANTLYFRSKWFDKFDKNETRSDKFNDDKSVEMMCKEMYLDYFEDETLQAIELLYEDTNYCFGIMLPKTYDTKDCFDYFINGKLIFQNEKAIIKIPKFKKKSIINLPNSHEQLDTMDLFDEPYNKSNLTGICKMSNFKDYANNIIHAVVITVNEEETEAATVTTILDTCSIMKIITDKRIFTANHTFIYYIKHKPSDIILFVGDYDGINNE